MHFLHALASRAEIVLQNDPPPQQQRKHSLIKSHFISVGRGDSHPSTDAVSTTAGQSKCKGNVDFQIKTWKLRVVKWALFLPLPLGQSGERVYTCTTAKRLSIFSMMSDGKCPPHSRASHSVMNPRIPTKVHFGGLARWPPSLSFFLGASDLKGQRGSLCLPAWQTEGPGSAEVAPLPKLLPAWKSPC